MQFQSINKTKGILYAAVSSSTFGLAPFFSVMLLNVGFSSFEVLSYRWGIASLTLILFGWLSGCNFRLNKKDFGTVFLLSLFRAATSLSLLIAYQNIASGVASIIHFMYPLAVAMSMILFFHERDRHGSLLPYRCRSSAPYSFRRETSVMVTATLRSVSYPPVYPYSLTADTLSE